MANKKGIAVVIPALLLVAAATGAPATATAAPGPRSLVAAAEPGDPPDQQGQQGAGNATTPPPAGGGGDQGDGGEVTPPPSGDVSAPPSGEESPPPGEESPPPDEETSPPPADPGQGQGNQQGVKEGPVAADFVNIRQAPRKPRVRPSRNGSRGSFSTRCGTNQNKHHNPDNYIVAPGVQNGAHHIHDYVGNLSTDGFSTDESLAAAGTTCAAGDKSVFFWPVMRVRAQQDDSGAAQQSAADGNVGRIVTPAAARMQFVGNPRTKVTAMPRFLRAITGDAKSGTNGPANARAQWTCSGFTDRVLTDKYPLCPRGSRVTRVLEFPSCWDGRNTDSANHRTHIVFADQQGNCPAGTRAVPQLRMTLSYNLPNQAVAFAVDSFPEQGHAPVTDHADFENIMPNSLMRRAVGCINSGRNC